MTAGVMQYPPRFPMRPLREATLLRERPGIVRPQAASTRL
jgi:hypothetical protein